MNTYEIHVTNTYIVRAKDSDEGRRLALLAFTGGTKQYEFGGTKITTIKNNTHKYKENSERSTGRQAAINKQENPFIIDKTEKLVSPFKTKQEKKHGKQAVGHRNRNVGEESEYIDFGKADGV